MAERWDLDDAEEAIHDSMSADDRQTSSQYKKATNALSGLLAELRIHRERERQWEDIDSYSSNTVITPPGGQVSTWDVTVEGGTKITGFVGATRLEALAAAAAWCREQLA